MEIEIKVPTVGESISEVTISNWIKKDGDFVKADEIICEIESDKATFELNAEQAGILKTFVKEGDTVAIGTKIASIDTAGVAPADTAPAAATDTAPAEKAPAAAPAVETKQEANTSYATGTPSPAAAKILDEKGISPAQVSGTGKDGRITKDDAVKANAPTTAPATAPAPTTQPTAPAATPIGERDSHREKMTTLRRTIAKRLVEAKNSTAMLTTFNEIDMSAVMEMRKKYKDLFKEKYNIGLGFMSLFTKAACEALKEFPAVNAMIDDTDLIFHDYMDIGVAVSTPRGLVVPVIRNAEKMSLAQIERSIADVAVKARDNKLTIEEMTGGTFTITNGGVFGSLMSTPIINVPQAAILGMHNIVERPMAVNGQVVIRPMMYVALSYDHRIIDGRESVSFLVRIKQMIEDPYRLLLEV
jgi:2-oxoglutarate dehydrogenase E2 component (dihydrolipoamide succinyltransferase)